jgi:ubiquinone/menaquinone biosynthesis C-methylase UbiE
VVLCSVRDPRAALREIHRVIRPGGQLRFVEHVRAKSPGLRGVQRIVDATVWPVLFGGCHTGRDTVRAVAEAGFTIVRTEEFEFPEMRIRLPTASHVLGVASRAAAEGSG